MRLILILCVATVVSACTGPSFVGDAPPVPVTSETPDHFELPARFALVRNVYGRQELAGVKEAALWKDLADRHDHLGSFSPLITAHPIWLLRDRTKLIEVAREQRYDYLILARLHPSTGAADITLYHVGSAGVMATSQAVSPFGGRRGFWGGRIRNPRKLERTTFRIAQALVPEVEDMLRGVVIRQR